MPKAKLYNLYSTTPFFSEGTNGGWQKQSKDNPTYPSSIDLSLSFCQSSMITLLKYFPLANPWEINPLFPESGWGVSVTWRNTVALATPDGFTLQPGIRETGYDKFAGDILHWAMESAVWKSTNEKHTVRRDAKWVCWLRFIHHK